MSKKRWIVVDIGCIECGADSNIVGVFDCKDRAEKVASECEALFEQQANAYEVFPMPPLNQIAEEYLIEGFMTTEAERETICNARKLGKADAVQ